MKKELIFQKIIILNRLKANLVDIFLLFTMISFLKIIGISNAIGIVPIYYFLFFYIKNTTLGGVLFKVETKSLNSDQGFKIFGIIIKVFIISNIIFYLEKVICGNINGLLIVFSLVFANYAFIFFNKKSLAILDYLSLSYIIKTKR